MTGIVEEAWMEAVQVAPIRVTLQNHRLHVVVEHLAQHAGKEVERMFMAQTQRLELLVVAELDIGRPAPAKCADEHLELV